MFRLDIGTLVAHFEREMVMATIQFIEIILLALSKRNILREI